MARRHSTARKGQSRAPKTDSEKIILKIFDPKTSEEKKPHTCSICAVYKREIAKGNRDALRFYKEHIAEVARKNNGVTVVLYGKMKKRLLEEMKSIKAPE